MLNADSLVLATGTTVGHRGPITAPEMRALFDAAADAGFSGVEFWVNHYDSAIADGMDPEEFFAYPRERGLALVATEMLASPAWETPDRREVAQACAHVLDLAVRAGSSTVLTVARAFSSFDDAMSGLRALCDEAADRDLTISLEMVPFGGCTTIAEVRRIFEAVDRDNLGLCLDFWHWHRQPGGPDLEGLRAIPGDRILILQVDDATPTPSDDLLVETMTARLLPGEGAADIPAVLDVLEEIGADPLIVSEVFSDELAKLGVAEHARRQFAASQAVFARHQASSAR